MSTKYAFENLLRSPLELLVSIVAIGFGTLCIVHHQWMLLTFKAGVLISVPFFAIALIRFSQGMRIWVYRKRLLTLKPFYMSITEIPKLKKLAYLGRGFRWLPIHRQRLHLFSFAKNQKFLQKNAIYRWLQLRAEKYPDGFCDYLTKVPFLPFKKKAEVGGKPWIHGVGADKEADVHVAEESRKGHTVVFGETGVGKSQAASVLIAQDIFRGQGVLILDPKGDIDLANNVYLSCLAANRLNDFYIIHAGIPDLSAKYNPLSRYDNVGDVATRVTSGIKAEGDGKQFKEFAWDFLNVTATCLEEMGEAITYKSLAFFVKNPRLLLLAYCDKILPTRDSSYLQGMDQIIKDNQQIDKYGNSSSPMKREGAVQLYVANYIEETIRKGEHKVLHDLIIADLHHMASLDEQYFKKIAANLGPAFDKINKTSAGSVFSWDGNFGLPTITLEGIIKRKQVVYMCLDSQTNRAMAEAVGQAVVADLNSLCGRLNKEGINPDRLLYLHADEFSEIVQDDFVALLSKARGSGVRITAYTQTVNDLGVAFASNKDKPGMLLGNFSNKIMMRVANLDTARVFTECLEDVRTRSVTPSTMSNDKADGENGDYFTTHNTDTVNEQHTKIVIENDLFSLPKGQTMTLTNGGEIYKTRIPLLRTEYKVPEKFGLLVSEVNLCRT